MSIFIKEFVSKKLKQVTTDELLHYGKEYGFAISRKEAEKIVHYLKTNTVDPFHSEGRKKMLKELARITDVKTAKKAQKLFHQLIKSYGLEHLLES
jgi:two-component SAPR family response regulator